MTDQTIVVSDLRDAPHFFDSVADRVWRAWWEPHGFPLDHITGLLRASLAEDEEQLCLVAHAGDRFVGTASVIASDLEERPDLTPWVAAVWVDPPFRRAGVGGDIVLKAAHAALDTGADTVHLCALPGKRAFYERLGWRLDESDVGEDRLDVFSMGRGSHRRASI
ncbi:GNAT family N-acetyltransferase [Ensifer adhaerens]|uniref:GNAT family N-acetyltransferase n=1 Tax=Ensifer adhaerens TaxID=106592 RepID=UPI001CBFD296|nr:GNAT family N-acetyltransferase [Ensifer adhaerens]MBZ7922712.1 GNAT family N-acetyltransferase [Ensifer adhaerens]UAX91322.1 GNAT family N-acetyltransferase [Ensifer adhaerens]UAX98950.1 GNAT family N-acetyltransferase [Ensifer adhaerens]UAY06333.1 GNAT family N-acetyltransferase [Ensifer adhaerens]